MANFPTHPIKIHKMFKSTGLCIINPEVEEGCFFIKISESKIKSKSDLLAAFEKLNLAALKHSINIELTIIRKSFSDFRLHGNYYEIHFKSL